MADGTAWGTGSGLAVEVAFEGPMCIEDDYSRDVGCPSRGGYPADSDGLTDTPLPPMFPLHALPDEWLDVYVKLAAFTRLIPLGTRAHTHQLYWGAVRSQSVWSSRGPMRSKLTLMRLRARRVPSSTMAWEWTKP